MKQLILCSLAILSFLFSDSQTTIIPYNSTWKYLDNNTRPANWHTSGFADGSWSTGSGEFGYGDGDEGTVVSHGGCSPIATCGPKPITTYFRKSVTIANPASYASFTLNVMRDDGIVIYINGTERYADNMPAGRTHGTLASGAASDDGNTPQTAVLLSSYFSAGTNVIAVEVHQNSNTSSDLSFDLNLVGNAIPVGFINFGSTWKYRDNDTRPANWHTTAYNDAAWASGASELGYGDAPATTVSYGPDVNNKYITTYFRKTFNIAGLSSYSGFTLNVVRDDGIVVYVNGNEVARDNMPGGTPTHATLASTAISGSGETTPITFSLSSCAFVEGTNTIAVEMHQSDGASTDLSFNLELTGTPTGGTPTLSRGPYLQKGSQTSITIRWRTSAACYGRVSVGPSAGTYTTATVDETCPTTEHIVTVNGLTPDTKYFYQISSTTGIVFEGGANNFFTTVPPTNTTRKVRIAAFGDCGRGNATYQDQTLAYYRNYLTANGIDAADAWILMGDNAYSTGTDAEYTSQFFNIYGPNLLKNHKLYPSPGNHDYGNNGGNKPSRSMPYYNIFSVPQNAECGGVASNKPNFYSFNVGNIHFLSLDSWGVETDLTDMGTSGTSTLKTWINADLAANTQKWTIAYWHHPPYTKTSHDSDNGGGGDPELPLIRQNFITYLESRGVDMIICGHSHGYERGYMLKNYTGSWASFNVGTHATSPSSGAYTSGSTCPYVYNSSPLNHGAVYVVAGSAGASGGTQGLFGTGPMPFSVNDGGVLFFEADENRLDAKMLRRNSTIFDQFTIMKDVNKSTVYTVTVGTNVTMTASWPGNYNWNTSASTQSINFTPAVAGTTNFTVTDNFGCVTDQFSVVASPTLPVSLVSYDVVLQNNNKVKVSWATETEINSKSFTVERSVNGTQFTPIGVIYATGNSTTRKDYSFIDDSPLPGVSYYRLAQTDIDNATTYLGVKRITNNLAKSFEVKTFSTKGGSLVLQFTAVSAAPAQLRVFDMNGRERHNERLAIAQGVTSKEVRLAPGVYIWEVRPDRGETFFQKIIVQ